MMLQDGSRQLVGFMDLSHLPKTDLIHHAVVRERFWPCMDMSLVCDTPEWSGLDVVPPTTWPPFWHADGAGPVRERLYLGINIDYQFNATSFSDLWALRTAKGRMKVQMHPYICCRVVFRPATTAVLVLTGSEMCPISNSSGVVWGDLLECISPR